MAPAQYYGNNQPYDPVNSQYRQQRQQGYVYPAAQGSSATPHYLEPSATADYQTSDTPDYHAPNSYATTSWSATAQAPSTSDNYAAQTLSNLSTQDRRQSTSTGSNHASGTQYPSSAYGSSYHSHLARQTHAESSPAQTASNTLHAPQSLAQRPPSTTPTHAPTTQPASSYTYTYTSQPPVPATVPNTTHGQPSSAAQSPKLPAPKQRRQQQPRQPRAVGSKGNVASPSLANRDNTREGTTSTVRAPSANVGQPRAPSITPSSVQQQHQQQQQVKYTATQSTSSANPAPTTVDPSQVYDSWPERQRMWQQIEEKHRLEQAAKKKLEEEEAERQRRVEEAQAAEAARRAAEEARAKERQMRAPAPPAQNTPTTQSTLAAASVGSAASAVTSGASESAGAVDLEVEMKAMFAKMREFSAKNPALLAKMWESERLAHVSKTKSPVQPSQQPPPAQPAQPAQQPPPSSTPKASAAPNISQPARRSPAQANPPPQSQSQQGRHGTQAPASAPAKPPTNNANTGGNTMWQADKKEALAHAATKWLNAQPQNAGKHITADRVSAMLDTSPSYPALCESLQALGVSVDMRMFARALIVAVPDVGVNRQGSGPAQINTSQAIASAAAAAAAAAAAPPTASATQGDRQHNLTATSAASTGNTVNVNGNKTTEPQNAGTRPPAAQHQTGISSQPPIAPQPPHDASALPGRSFTSPYFVQNQNGHETPSQTPRPSAKPAQTQKAVPPRPPPANKVEAARKRNFSELVDLTAVDESDDDEPAAKQPNLQQTGVTEYAAEGASNQFMATGQHPETPAVTQSYGGTFIRQLVPATAPAKEPVVVGSIADELTGKILVQRIHKSQVARKNSYDPRTICRDVLLATGRHPELKALNSHLSGMLDFLKHHSESVEGDRFDLTTIRWDMIDPGEPIHQQSKHSDVSEEEGSPERKRANVKSSQAKDTMVEPVFEHGQGKGRRRANSANQLGGESSEVGTNTDATSRLPKSTPRPLHHSGWTPANKQSKTTSTPMSVPAAGSVGYTAFNQQRVQYDENGNPIKRKGRPVGWRKAIHSKAAQVAGGSSATSEAVVVRIPPSQNSHPGPARRGRPAKSGPSQRPSASAAAEVNASFNVYKCEWEDCNAELHNIDTLRKHVLKLHSKASDVGTFECSWAGCFDATDELYEFELLTDWAAHVEEAHIRALAKKLGDGPKKGLSEPIKSEESEKLYLSDQSGRQVTPKLRAPAEGTPEWARAQQRGDAAKRLTELTNQKLEDEKFLQQLEEKKRVIGPGLDRAGCRLATLARRRGFYDDEDFCDVIESDDLE